MSHDPDQAHSPIDLSPDLRDPLHPQIFHCTDLFSVIEAIEQPS